MLSVMLRLDFQLLRTSATTVSPEVREAAPPAARLLPPTPMPLPYPPPDLPKLESPFRCCWTPPPLPASPRPPQPPTAARAPAAAAASWLCRAPARNGEPRAAVGLRGAAEAELARAAPAACFMLTLFMLCWTRQLATRHLAPSETPST